MMPGTGMMPGAGMPGIPVGMDESGPLLTHDLMSVNEQIDLRQAARDVATKMHAALREVFEEEPTSLVMKKNENLIYNFTSTKIEMQERDVDHGDV